MTIKAAILAGAAAAVAALGQSAALAQSTDNAARYGYGPPVSTPAEMQQTARLNEQAINGTTQSPAVLNGEAPAPYQNGPAGYEGGAPYQNGPAGYEGGKPYQNSPYSQTQYAGPPPANENAPVGDEPYATGPGGQMQYGPPPNNPAEREPGYGPTQYGPYAQYQEREQQYQNQMQRYGREQQNYTNQRERYAQNVEAYDLAEYAWSYPEPYVYHYGDEYGLQPLYLMAEPSQQLWQVPVEGPGGSWVGRVRNVQIAPDGRPSRVEIALNRRVSVWVQPGDLRFDPDEDALYTDLTRGQLWSMPGATVASAPL
jgi:hypothetical protein